MDKENQQIKALEDEIIADADVSLIGMINVDELLADPKGHLEMVANKFLMKHLSKIKEAGKIGKKLAEELI